MKRIVFICSYIFYHFIPNYPVQPIQNFFQTQALKDRDDGINFLYVQDSSMHPCETLSMVAEIASEVYNIKESLVYQKLQNQRLLYKVNLQKLKLNLLAQTKNYKKLKEALYDELEINSQDLRTILFFVEGKRYYKEFKLIERYVLKKGSIENQDYQECISLISFLQNNKEPENNKN